jgi:MOSC domain-containing protein YiiM
MRGTLVQVNVSPGGMPKLPVDSVHVSKDGLTGDWQLNRKYHGGPDRAVCLYSAELYDQFREEGLNMTWGGVGENFTTQGFDLMSLERGSRLRVGECLIEITNVREPCKSLRKWHFQLPYLIDGRSGWVARVLEEGDVKKGDVIETIE